MYLQLHSLTFIKTEQLSNIIVDSGHIKCDNLHSFNCFLNMYISTHINETILTKETNTNPEQLIRDQTVQYQIRNQTLQYQIRDQAVQYQIRL